MQPVLFSPSRSEATSRRARDASKQGPWRCSNCPKEFAQSEYYALSCFVMVIPFEKMTVRACTANNRTPGSTLLHSFFSSLRCIQSSQRQKLSKQKSCTACAASKLSCDLGTPSCSRCINRNKTCRYVSANNPNATSQQIEASQRGHHARTNSGQPYDNTVIGNSSSLSSYSTRRQSDLELEAVMHNAGDQSRTSATSNGLPLAALQQQPLPAHTPHGININGWQVNTQTNRPNAGFGDPTPSPGQLERDSISLFNLGNETEAASRWQQEIPWFSQNAFLSPELPISPELEDPSQGSGFTGASEDLNFDLLGSLGILTQNRITPGQASQPGGFSTMLNTPASSDGHYPTTTSIANHHSNQNSPLDIEAATEQGKTLHGAVKAARGTELSNTVAPRLPYGISPNLQSCPFHRLHKDDDLIKMVSNYPSVMLKPGVYPPFVHHKLYRCSAGDVAEPLAKAFCCVGAFYASVPVSETFVYSLINEETNKLVKGFHQLPGSDADMLAVVHAMCIYQILGFFVSVNPEQTRAAESQQMFFLKMTRRLAKQYLQTSAVEDGEESNWRKWLMDETIRRTVFLVNAINTLSCRVQKQDPNYFEPLDNALIHNLTLPAPEAIWKASSAEEWTLAKSQLPANDFTRTKVTVRQAVDQIKSIGRSGDRGTHISPLRFDMFDDFTKLVIATADVQ
ncbi:hypothetical protein FMEXI_2384 [Fusarium mexicanum]|uniref:Zn(2)-C6 fungal-type domain-containing protein n=1 Tax=Fusarium mexicanum TaxID=751941 RepID=A0A8H5JE76_9HYPO|nr:hypothetical protein FMEXI_2384 [Fusarium mexicanum]